MFNFIPIEYYTPIYYYILFIYIFLILSKSNNNLSDNIIIFFSNKMGLFLFFFTIIYVGFRPLNTGYFGDMETYNLKYLRLQNGFGVNISRDLFFEIFMRFCSGIMSSVMFFFVMSFIYVFSIYVASKRWFKSNWGYAFYILLASLSFWSYGTNGIRNGVATSLVLLGLSYSNRKIWMITFFIIALLFHKSVILPIFAYVVTLFYNDSKKFIYFWLFCIPLSLVLGGSFETFFVGLGIFEDDRLSYLTEGNVNGDHFSYTGFRWDFLLYSASAVYAGYFFVFKRGFHDKIYSQLLNVYLISNAFWVLVIRANFSNRFAYLSWFMMGIVIIYPFLKQEFFKNQNVVLSRVLLLYFLFTFFMNVIL